MIRGTTAQFKFNLPYNYSDLSLVEVTFWQPGNKGPDEVTRPLPIVKVLGQCSACENANEISTTLTEEETLRFSEETKAYVQLRAQTYDGITFATKQETITVYPIYGDGTLDENILPTPSYDGWIYLDGHPIVE